MRTTRRRAKKCPMSGMSPRKEIRALDAEIKESARQAEEESEELESLGRVSKGGLSSVAAVGADR